MSDQTDAGFSKGSSQSVPKASEKKIMLSWDKKKSLLCLKSKTAQKTRKSITKKNMKDQFSKYQVLAVEPY